ncbi:AAA family ATPase [Hymenobacter siberiensis]|uniref:AAA family ATPase n=1 Tax=Hymenobacter siberiensis TaxID=2848396 RepID=UPI001C1DFC9D|nr:AAA family ATPase [Hymenobacter siberiensis]MBU6122276.1 AAA family ATPase [Hymenobacter siberiensis]
MGYQFTKAAFIEQYKKLRYLREDGKKAGELTSILCTLLSFDMTERSLGKPGLDLRNKGPERKKLGEVFGGLMTFDTSKTPRRYLLARELGWLTWSDKDAKGVLSSNFLTGKVKAASTAAQPMSYPGGQRGTAVLEVGKGADKTEASKVDDWSTGLLSLAENRNLDEYDVDNPDLGPLIVFILRDVVFAEEVISDTEDVITAALKAVLTDEVAEFLIERTDFNKWAGWFSEESLFDAFPYETLLKELSEGEDEDEGGNEPKAHATDFPRNRIIYGAPGTGKSNKLKTEALGFEETRVMFHPDYTYSQFVGGYRPATLYRTLAEGVKIFDVSKRDKVVPQLEPVIDYALASGPFLDVLVKALNDKTKNYLLIIEEINRANVAAVFGDVFQLLDRDDSGVSEYDVTPNHEIGAFLKATIEGFSGKMRLPANMYIWATMNSADQGVFPMDSAFKRRWSFEYLPLNQPKQDFLLRKLKVTFLGQKYYWVPFRKALNDFLTDRAKVSEDKLLGAFYMKKSELGDPDAIKNKLLLYLREDVLRHNHTALFERPTFSQIAEAYDKGGAGLFKMDFIKSLIELNDKYALSGAPTAPEGAPGDEGMAEDEETSEEGEMMEDEDGSQDEG